MVGIAIRNENFALRDLESPKHIPPIIVANARAKYPVYYDEWKWAQRHKPTRQTGWIKLFGFIPFVKIKHKHGQTKVYLFDTIQLARIKHD